MKPNYIPAIKRTTLFKLYDEIILSGLKYHRMQPGYLKIKKSKVYALAKGHNLVRRLRDFKHETTLFIMGPNIPFTNNLAEQDLRMMKVQQKISGCFRSWFGAHIFARIRSFISTAQKQDGDLFSTIKHAVKGSHGLNYYIKLHIAD